MISIRNFYKVAIAEIRKRFEFDDDAFAVLKLVKPSNARKLLPSSLFDFFQRFPNVKEAVDPEMAEEEWRDHINLPLQLFQITKESAFIEMNPEVYWEVVFSSSDLNGNPKFPNQKNLFHPLKDY